MARDHHSRRPRSRARKAFQHHLPAGLTHFLFAHIIAEVCDALALVTIALGLSKRVAPLVPGALQHR